MPPACFKLNPPSSSSSSPESPFFSLGFFSVRFLLQISELDLWTQTKRGQDLVESTSERSSQSCKQASKQDSQASRRADERAGGRTGKQARTPRARSLRSSASASSTAPSL